MKALIYRRDKQKYDFIFVSDDDILLDAYQSVYACTPVVMPSGISAGLYSESNESFDPYEDMLRKVISYLTDILIKPFSCVCYIKEACAVFSMLPEQTGIQKTSLKEASVKKILQITENLMYVTLKPQEGLLAMHGGIAAKDGKAALILAPTGAGKSTLTAFMALRGYVYITDDEIYISCETMRVESAAPSPILLREGGYRILRGILGEENEALSRARPVISGAEERYMIPLADGANDLGRESYEIAAAVFINAFASKAPYIKKLSMNEAFSRLLKSQLVPQNRTKEMYKVLADLSGKAYEMEYSDLWTAEHYLRHLLV